MLEEKIQKTPEQIEDGVREILGKILRMEPENVKGITRDKNFQEDLGMDSLDGVELIMAIEDKYGVEIPDEKAQSFKTFGEVVDYVVEKYKKQENREQENYAGRQEN